MIIHGMSTTTIPNSTPQGLATRGVAPLSHLGVIRVEGEEAAKFLQGQLTQDFALLGLSEARLAAFCSAKGRMQASFVGFKRSHDEILLVCSRDLLAATLKRLSMFVLRAKARLSDASDAFAVFGLVGQAVPSALPEAAWSQWRDGEASVVRSREDLLARGVCAGELVLDRARTEFEGLYGTRKSCMYSTASVAGPSSPCSEVSSASLEDVWGSARTCTGSSKGFCPLEA